MGNEALAVYQPEVCESLAITRAPEIVLAEAKKAAAALGDVIRGKAKPVIFNGEQYLEFEDWQTVGRFYGVTAKVVSTSPVTFGDVIGFEARAVVVRADGQEISAADSMCLNDEEKWSSRAKYEWVDGVRTQTGMTAVPLFQLRSMAQTRACAKALRNVLAWVVVLAGYRPTPAEEMDGVRGFSRPDANGAGATTKTSGGAAATVSGNTVKGIVTSVTTKAGKNNSTNYGIIVGGNRYGTFSDTIGHAAQALVDHEAVVTFRQDGKWFNAEGIVAAAAETAAPAQERTAEDEALDRELAEQGK